MLSVSQRSGASSPSAWIIARGQSIRACSEPLTCGYHTWSACRGPIATRHLLGDAVAVAHTPCGVTLTMGWGRQGHVQGLIAFGADVTNQFLQLNGLQVLP